MVTVEGDDGFTATSNAETQEAIADVLNANVGRAGDDEPETESTDGSRGRSKDGKFVSVRPIPPDKLKAKVDEKAGPDDDVKSDDDVKPDEDAKAEDDAEDEPKKEAGAKEEPKEKPKAEETKEERDSKAKQRIHEVIEQRRQVEAENRRLRAELASMTPAQRAQPPATDTAGSDGLPPPPKEADFQDYSDYVRAQSEHSALVAMQRMLSGAQQHQQKQEFAEKVHGALGAFHDGIEKAGGEQFLRSLPPEITTIQPSFIVRPDGSVESLPQNEIGPLNVLADEIIAAGPKGPTILKHLSENLDTYRRISSAASPDAVYRILGGIEALTAATAGNPAPSVPRYEPKANPPVKPVTGSPSVRDDDVSINDEISFEEHVRRENERELKKRRARLG